MNIRSLLAVLLTASLVPHAVLAFGKKKSDEPAEVKKVSLHVQFPKEYMIQIFFEEEDLDSIHNGFKNWEDAISEVTGTDFHFVYKGIASAQVNYDREDQLHVVMKNVMWDEQKKQPMAETLGYTWRFFTHTPGFGYSYIPGADIHVDMSREIHHSDDYHFGGLRSEFSVCLEALIAHEVGHLIGLEHSKVSEDIMYPTMGSDQCGNRKPTDHDVERLRELYLNNREFLRPLFPGGKL